MSLLVGLVVYFVVAALILAFMMSPSVFMTGGEWVGCAFLCAWLFWLGPTFVILMVTGWS